MFRTIGYVCLVILIGGFAIAWSRGPERQTKQAETIAPDQLPVDTKALPQQEFNDMTFVYTTEQ